MFGFFKKEPSRNKGPSSHLRVMGHDLDIISITRNGKVLFTGEIAEEFPKEHLEGKIFELAFITRSGNPYFVYYLCEDYYLAVAIPGGAGSFGGPFETEKFRTAVSQAIGVVVVSLLKASVNIDASRDIVSFSHNRANTNTLTYVTSLSDWYPIQHSVSEHEDAAERKAARVNSGRADIADVIAVDSLSPSE